MKNNPRRLKQFLNNLYLIQSLTDDKGVAIDFKPLLYWNIIKHAYPSFGKKIIDNKGNFETIKKEIARLEGTGDESHGFSEKEIRKAPLDLQEYLRDRELVELLKGIAINREMLEKLISNSNIVEADVPLFFPP